MELRHLRYFLAVAEELNFRRAAKKIGISQPPLTKQIQDLETEVGVLLLRRTTRGAELTEAGAAFLAEMPGVFDQVTRAIRMAQRAARGNTGEIRVGFTGSTSFNEIVPRSLQSFRLSHPGVQLRLCEENSLQLMERLEQRRLDAAFVRVSLQDLKHPAMTLLCEERMVALVSARHRLAKRKSVALSGLKDEPMVLFSRDLGPALYDEVALACRAAGFEPLISQIAPQLTSIGNFVAVDLGVSIVPEKLAEAAMPGVVVLPFAGKAPVARLALATRERDPSMVTRNFVALVKDVARTHATNLKKRL